MIVLLDNEREQEIEVSNEGLETLGLGECWMSQAY